MSKKKKSLSAVKLVKEMSRERVPAPHARVIPDKRRKKAESEAKSIAARFGEDI